MRKRAIPETAEMRIARLDSKARARREDASAEQSALDEMVRKSIAIHGP